MSIDTIRAGILVLRPGRRSFHWTEEESVASVAIDGKGRMVCGRGAKTLVKPDLVQV
jgi:hypothetical protein